MMQDQILERARGLNWPMVVVRGGAISTENGWRREASAAHARRVELDAAEDQRARDREDARTPDPELAENARREAAEDLARHVAERPARMEALLARIADAVEALQRR